MDAWGVDDRYLDSAKVEHVISADSIAAVRELIGTAPDDLERTAPLVLVRGRPSDLSGTALLEDGSEQPVQPGALTLPLGYHELHTPDGGTRPLIVSPGRCCRPSRRAWGWAVQLYAARSRTSWGIGNLADLRTVNEWATEQGAGFLLVNPLDASGLVAPLEASPYSPTTRRYRSPLYLSVADLPGTDRVDLTAATAAARTLNDDPAIDRDAVWRVLRPVLEELFAVSRSDPDFLAWRGQQGRPLDEWATWSALVDAHGPSWRNWPTPLRRPDSADVARFADEHADAVGFHAWLQYHLSRQLDDAVRAGTVIQDLPIGFDPSGADAWVWQDLLAFDASVGAPPDPFNLAGQDWGLPPFVPWKLRQAGYGPFIESIRATMAAGGGLRIDHVAGLFRLWWIPTHVDARQGAYVRYPAEDLINLVALESERAGAVVVGEDLGTVEDVVRDTMAAAGMLSYRLLWFEEDEPRNWPVEAMAAVTTHDLPTVAGLWSGADLRDQQSHGVPADEASTVQLRERLADLAGIGAAAAPPDAVVGAYRALAQAPCTLLTATLEDALAVEIRPNIPGTTDRANWSRALPVPIEELAGSAPAAAVADVLTAAVGYGPDVADEDERVEHRAQLLPEERAAASDDPEAQAEVILADSDARTEDPEGTMRDSHQTPQ
jgi:4-alpha-glucanotransferase